MKKKGLLKIFKQAALSGVVVAAGVAGIMKNDNTRSKVVRNVPPLKKIFLNEIEGETFSEAFREARQRGLKTFVWAQNGGVYTTDYKGSSKEQMTVYGMDDNQLQDRHWWQERLANNLRPRGYDHVICRAWRAIVLNEDDNNDDIGTSRMDYYNIYMGRPQENKTLGISDYIPTDVKEINGRRLPDKGQVFYKDNELSRYLAKYWAIYARHLLAENNHRESRIYHRDMGHFKMSLGHDGKGDYICYHDTWNLAPLGPTTDFGKPFEIYDRIYFDMEKIDGAFQKQRSMIEMDDVAMPTTVFMGHRKLKDGDVEQYRKDLVSGSSTIIRRDKNGRARYQVVQDADGKTLEIIHYARNKKGLLIREIYSDGDHFMTQRVDYTYDNNGHKASVIYSDCHEQMVKRTDYIRNKEGRLVKEIDDAVAGNKDEYFYDETGSIVGEIHRFKGKLIGGYGEEYKKAITQTAASKAIELDR